MNAALINLFSLKDKIALVTGANTGIGLAIAEGLAEAGAHILAANRNREEGEAAVREMVDKGYQADFYPVDVSEKKSIDDLFAWVEKNYGTLDILVNNAGINRMKKIMDFNDDDWEAVMNVDLRGTFYCSKAAFPLMKEKGGKSSISARLPPTSASITAHPPIRWARAASTSSRRCAPWSGPRIKSSSMQSRPACASRASTRTITTSTPTC